LGLKGSAFLAIWHDIAEGAHGDYVEWHTREHMPERLSIPGFRTGKRLHAPGSERHVFGTIYAGDGVDVFQSPAYLERLNNPTAWTAAVAPSFRNFLRVACERIAFAGQGDGGSMATLRFDFLGTEPEARLRAAASTLVRDVLALPSVCSVHLGVARAEVSGVRTRETELRAAMSERGFDVVLLVEGSARPGLEAAMPGIFKLCAATGALGVPVAAIYETAYTLTAQDMEAPDREASGMGAQG
jgi:hypothetical protein